jgi:hypothetical protein
VLNSLPPNALQLTTFHIWASGCYWQTTQQLEGWSPCSWSTWWWPNSSSGLSRHHGQTFEAPVKSCAHPSKSIPSKLQSRSSDIFFVLSFWQTSWKPKVFQSKECQIQGIGEAEDADSLVQEIRKSLLYLFLKPGQTLNLPELALPSLGNEIASDAYGHGSHDRTTASIP